jgi:simple sugar transport system permease protein
MAEITKEKEKLEEKTTSEKIRSFALNNSVTILFGLICLAGVYISELSGFFIVNELLTRLTRNSFLVLALIIPVIAGMGLNFSIVIGAMAGQIALVIAVVFNLSGFGGILLVIAISTPIAILFGILTGKLLNRTRGQEMIASMIAGFFANGLYQFLFLFLVGTAIPLKDDFIVLSNGIGLRNTIDLNAREGFDGLKYAFDNVAKLPLFYAIPLIAFLIVGYMYFKNKNRILDTVKRKAIVIVLAALTVISLYMNFYTGLSPAVKMYTNIKVPLFTLTLIVLLCIFNEIILKTKLGQDLKTVGQNQHISSVAGIKVDKVRIIAITFSIVLAAWGQIIFLQNMGVLNTYGSHVQIGLFSVAALLIGGASASKATVGQAILGVLLFHTLFIVSPKAGQNLFGEAQIGEFFRAFVAYGVIGVSLGLHAWKQLRQKK